MFLQRTSQTLIPQTSKYTAQTSDYTSKTLSKRRMKFTHVVSSRIKKVKVNPYAVFDTENKAKDAKGNARAYKTLIHNYCRDLKTNFKEALRILKREHNRLSEEQID